MTASSTPGRVIHPRIFYNEIVQPSYQAFIATPTLEWICKAAVSNADTMAERMFYFWQFIIKKDPSSDEDAIEAARSAILGFTHVRQYREHLTTICPDFQLVWDIHDAHKHYELGRPNRALTHADQTGTVPMVWNRMRFPWSRATTPSWTDTEVIFVTRDDGQVAPVLNVLSNVMAMWDDELARVSL
jgi:hypothetical protein